MDLKKMASNTTFASRLTKEQSEAWENIKDVIRNFLGNRRAENFKTKIADMISSFKKIGVNMSSKIHYMDDHVDDFAPNCGDYSDEQG